MKYFSEVLNRTFDTPEECDKAEREAAEAEAERVKEEEKSKSLVSKKKKELVSQIADADKTVEKASKEYDDAYAEAKQIIKDANDKAAEILKAAARKKADACEQRMLRIKEFNEEFGPYTTTYVGDRAQEEYNRIMKKMRDTFRGIPFFDWIF